ncbi:MAG TPA: hypothetical protein VF600_11080 [Abditibacteriaceae bacterium]|jgi:hypothetical protein
MKHTLLTLILLALLTQIALSVAAAPAQASNDIVIRQGGKPKQPAPPPAPTPRKPGPRDDGDDA